MAFVVILLSSFLGVVASITALVFSDATWFQALMIYIAASLVPAALVMAGVYLHMQITRALTMPDDSTRARATR